MPSRDGSRTHLDASVGELTVRTDVTGRAAKMGHRLTIVMESWRIEIAWHEQTPVSAELVVEVDSLKVVDGHGGVTPLTAPEQAVARTNALKTLDVKRHPTIGFRAETITPVEGGYRLSGPLGIHGVSRPTEVDVLVDGSRLSCSAEVSQRDFNVKPYSMALGALKVADVVAVSFTARPDAPKGSDIGN
jgi:polyisoprenoid-binding protein YceI